MSYYYHYYYYYYLLESSADRRHETLSHDRKYVKFSNPGWQVQTLIANIFRTDKAIDGIINDDPSYVRQKKLAKLWSINHIVYAANVYQRINSARDFGQLYTSMANISGSDHAID